MITMREPQACARATATAWRCPPDMPSTGAATDGMSILRWRSSSDVRRRIVRPSRKPEPAEHAGLQRLAAEEQVGGGVEVVREREVLVDGLDAVGARLARRAERDGIAVDQDLAARRAHDAREDLDQRRLACAVVADDRVHLAGAQVEADAAQGDDAPEALGHVARLEDRIVTRPRARGGVRGGRRRRRARLVGRRSHDGGEYAETRQRCQAPMRRSRWRPHAEPPHDDRRRPRRRA